MLTVVKPPGVQVFPFGLLEVRVTLSPLQNVVGPFAVMVGDDGIGFTVTFTGAETKELQVPFVIQTVKFPVL